MKQKEFLSHIDKEAIVAAIRQAEAACSGEIRVHVQPTTMGRDIREVGERTFERLGMTRTELRNGVLLFIASEQQQFVILGDRGIDEKVGDGFWDAISHRLAERFHAGELTLGIVEAIGAAGSSLAEHFPRSLHDVDELTDEISIED